VYQFCGSVWKILIPHQAQECEQREATHTIAKSVITKAQQIEADTDHQEDAEQLPDGVEHSSSPLDVFASCRQSKVKTMFLERSNRQNTYCAISIAKRWPEFATKRTDGSGVFRIVDLFGYPRPI